MPTHYRIKNWSKFQHYSKRNPPWIKLHVEILSSPDWVMLADASKLLAVVCMVIAAKENGVFPNNLDYIKRVAYLDRRPNLTPLIDCGFIVETLAPASISKQKQATARPEKEKEAEHIVREEKKVSKKDPPKAVSKSKRSPIPENWLPSEKDIAHAKNRKLDPETIKAVGEQFRDHHIAKGTLFANHSAAWRTWIKNHIGYHGTGPWPSNGRKRAGRNGNGSASVVDVVTRLRAEAHREELGGGMGVRVPSDGLRVRKDAGSPGDNGEVLEAHETERMLGASRGIKVVDGS